MKRKEARAEDIFEVDYQYEYGDLPDLHPKSDTSKFICSQIKRRKLSSYGYLETKHPQWRKVENKKNCFVPLTSLEKRQKANDPELPLATIIPHSLATLDTTVAKFAKDYIHRNMHRYEGFGSSEAIVSAILREEIVAESDQFFKNGLHFMTMMESAITYGFGVAGTQWRTHKRKGQGMEEVTPLVHEVLKTQGLNEAQIGDWIETQQEVVEVEGTEVVPISNWNVFLDPSMTGNKFNSSEFWGYMFETNPFDLISNEADHASGLFNAKYARLLTLAERGVDPLYREGSRGGQNMAHSELSRDGTRERIQPTIWVQRLIPSEWGLKNTDKPETWLFMTSGDCVVHMASALSEDHGLLGGLFMAPTTDGHDMIPLSLMERTYGISEATDWMVRSRMHEVMATGQRFLFHPLYIDPEEVLNNGPNAAIPLRPAAYQMPGPIDQWFKQLDFRNVTANHWGDIQSLLQVAKDTDGTVDIVKGDMSSMPERPGSAGMQDAMNRALSRIDYFIRKASMQALDDFSYMAGCNIDQYMDKAAIINATGKNRGTDLRDIFGSDASQIEVNRQDLLYSRDETGRVIRHQWRVVPHDQPLTAPENPQAMQQVSNILMGNPLFQQEIAQTFDPTKMLLRLAELGGVHYARELLRRKPKQMAAGIMPDEQVDKQVAAGNMITQQQANQELQRG